MQIPFDALTDDAKIWIFPSSRKFYDEEITEITSKIEEFLKDWQVCEGDFQTSFCINYQRFLIFGAATDGAKITVDAINELNELIINFQEIYEVLLLDKLNVCFKQGAYVQYKEVKDFKKLIKNKSVNAQTIVFDNLITTKADFTDFWEIPLEESWYNRFL